METDLVLSYDFMFNQSSDGMICDTILIQQIIVDNGTLKKRKFFGKE